MLTGAGRRTAHSLSRAVPHRARPARLTAEQLQHLAEHDFRPQPGDRSLHHVGMCITLASMVASGLGLGFLLRMVLFRA